MTETIETGLVYIHRIAPAKEFVGCGALVEGGYIATCRHVWLDAIDGVAEAEVEIEYPRSRENGAAARNTARLADACDQAGHGAPDLVLLVPEGIPHGVMALPLARHYRFEVGSGYAHARVMRTDPNGREVWRDLRPKGEIDANADDDEPRQFTGTVPQGYWFTPGSSGSPLFIDGGMQLAGILSLSELGANTGDSHLHEALVVPATTIWKFVARRTAQPFAAREGIAPEALQPILAALGLQDVPASEIPARLKQAVDDMRARAAQPVQPSNDGSDIDATIGASRDKLRELDTDGARALLQGKIDEETEARTRRLVPLLKERAAIERLAFDHEAAKATLAEIAGLTPDDVWVWIDLGDSWRTVGDLNRAAEAYRSAEQTARRIGDERNLSVSHERIGDVLLAQGERAGALDAYRAGLAISETLAGHDAGNTQWQRDLSVSNNKIGDVLLAQDDRDGALDAYRAGLAISETLARRDPANTQWQRDLSISHERIGDVLLAQGERDGALNAYRAGLAIRETLARRDPANAEWQRDLSVSHNKIGDVLLAQGEREGALAAYRAGLAIRETLARRDPRNTQWQRDIVGSCVRIADADPAAAPALLTRALDIATRLDAAGRLAPVDAGMPGDLARRLAQLGAAPKPKRPRAARDRTRNDAPAKSP